MVEPPSTLQAEPSVATTLTNNYVLITKGILLADNASNATLLETNNGSTLPVVLSGRTLYKDGSWNTLCLPFAVSDFTGTPLDGATVKTLESTSLADGTLTLTFSDDLTALENGKPYIVKWKTTGDDIANPVFNDVTISNTTTDVTTSAVTFKGIFSPYAIADEDKTMLYLGANNTLYYPDAEMTIGACRAYFQLNGITAGTPSGVRAFVLNFGDGEATEIAGIPHETHETLEPLWFTLDGRRLSGKPTQRGMYINNSKKVIIK